MANAFRDGAIRTTGTDIDKILPAMSRFGGGNRQEKNKTVIEKLKGQIIYPDIPSWSVLFAV